MKSLMILMMSLVVMISYEKEAESKQVKAIAGSEYIIQKGDTLTSISKDAYGERADDIWGEDIIFRANTRMIFKLAGKKLIGRGDFAPGVKIQIPHLVEKELIPYIEMFKKYLIKYGHLNLIKKVEQQTVTYGAAWTEESPDSAGSCQRYYNQVIIDPEKGCSKFILFHELGHCVLGLDHSDHDNTLMSKSVPTHGCAAPEAYLKHMFENIEHFPGWE